MSEITDRITDSMVFDQARWIAAWLDTPWMQQGGHSPEEAARKPGCCVKSRARASNTFPLHYGRLVSFDEIGDRAVVRGHDTPPSPRFVWEGTASEYLALWECD